MDRKDNNFCMSFNQASGRRPQTSSARPSDPKKHSRTTGLVAKVHVQSHIRPSTARNLKWNTSMQPQGKRSIRKQLLPNMKVMMQNAQKDEAEKVRRQVHANNTKTRQSQTFEVFTKRRTPSSATGQRKPIDITAQREEIVGKLGLFLQSTRSTSQQQQTQAQINTSRAQTARSIRPPPRRPTTSYKSNNTQNHTSNNNQNNNISSSDDNFNIGHEGCMCRGECLQGLGVVHGDVGVSDELGWNVNYNDHKQLVKDLNNTLNTLINNWRKQVNHNNCGHVATGNNNNTDIKDYSHDPTGERDHLFDHIEELENGFRELHIWDNVMSNLANTRSICPSRTLGVLLDRIRLHYSQYFNSFEFLFVEIRRRLKIDWKLSELKKKQDEIIKLQKEKLYKINNNLDDEIIGINNREEELDEVKQSLQYITKNGVFKSSQEEDENRIVLPDFNDPSSDEDGGAFQRRDDLGTYLDLHYEGQSEKERQLATKIKLHDLTDGSVISGVVTFTSYYYRFHIDKDDIGVTFKLSRNMQTEELPESMKQSDVSKIIESLNAPQLEHSENYLELTLNYGCPPTSGLRTHHVNTMNNSDCELTLSGTAMKPGYWYARIVGRGFQRKRFHMSYRVTTGVLTMEKPLDILMDDFDTEVQWQSMLVDKMSYLEEVLAHKKLVLHGPIIKKPKTTTTAVQAVHSEPTLMSDLKENTSLIECDEGEGVHIVGILKEYFTLLPPNDIVIMEKSKVLLMIGQLFVTKMMMDKTDNRLSVERMEFPQFLFDTYTKRYGIAKISELRLHELLTSARRHYYKDKDYSKISSRISVFLQSLGIIRPHWGNKHMNWYFDGKYLLKKHCQKYKISFLDNEKGVNMIKSRIVIKSVINDFFTISKNNQKCSLEYDISLPPLKSFIYATLETNKIKNKKKRIKQKLFDTDDFLVSLVKVCDQIEHAKQLQPKIDAIYETADPNRQNIISFIRFQSIQKTYLLFLSPFESFILYFRASLVSPDIRNHITIEGFRYVFYLHELYNYQDHTKYYDKTIVTDPVELLIKTKHSIDLPNRNEVNEAYDNHMRYLKKFHPELVPNKPPKKASSLKNRNKNNGNNTDEKKKNELYTLNPDGELLMNRLYDISEFTEDELNIVRYEYISTTWCALEPILTYEINRLSEIDVSVDEINSLQTQLSLFINRYGAMKVSDIINLVIVWEEMHLLINRIWNALLSYYAV